MNTVQKPNPLLVDKYPQGHPNFNPEIYGLNKGWLINWGSFRSPKRTPQTTKNINNNNNESKFKSRNQGPNLLSASH